MKKTLQQRLGMIMYDHLSGDCCDEAVIDQLSIKLRELLADAQIEEHEAYCEAECGFRHRDEICKRWSIDPLMR